MTKQELQDLLKKVLNDQPQNVYRVAENVSVSPQSIICIRSRFRQGKMVENKTKLLYRLARWLKPEIWNYFVNDKNFIHEDDFIRDGIVSKPIYKNRRGRPSKYRPAEDSVE